MGSETNALRMGRSSCRCLCQSCYPFAPPPSASAHSDSKVLKVISVHIHEARKGKTWQLELVDLVLRELQ